MNAASNGVNAEPKPAAAKRDGAKSVGAKPAAANPADEPSRVLDLADREWHLPAGPTSHPVPCVQPPLRRLADAEGWAREAARAHALLLS